MRFNLTSFLLLFLEDCSCFNGARERIPFVAASFSIYSCFDATREEHDTHTHH